MNLAEDLRADLQDTLVSGAVEIRENDSRPGIELWPAPPLVYLIAPALRLGLSGSSCRGLRVMFRQ